MSTPRALTRAHAPVNYSKRGTAPASPRHRFTLRLAASAREGGRCGVARCPLPDCRLVVLKADQGRKRDPKDAPAQAREAQS